jgi:glycosyltransferase involved in cell wall biosynthesis
VPPGELRGNLDVVNEDLIEGWARDEADPDRPVKLRILDNGLLIGEVWADLYRADLERAGIGAGRHAFSFSVPGGLSPLFRHVVQLQRESDWQDLSRPKTFGPTIEPVPPPVTPAPVLRDDGLIGNLDLVTRELIEGWASDSANKDEPVALLILDNGIEIARALANAYRQDLKDAGFGDGRRAFRINIPGGLSPMSRHVIQVKRAHDGADIPGSPAVIEAAGTFDTMLQRTLANTIAALEGDERQLDALSFLTGQLERLLALRADSDGRASKRRAYKQFRRRWGPQAAAITDMPNPGLRALVVDTRIPVSGRDAGSHALLSHMRGLRDLGYEVSFVASEEMRKTGQAVAALIEAGFIWHGSPFYTSLEDVLRAQAHCFDVVYLHRPEVASRYLALARQSNARARILYSVADLHHVRLARQARIEERPELQGVSHRMRLQECTAAWLSDAVITHSPDEAAVLRQAVPTAQVNVVRWAVQVRERRVAFRERRGIAFIGGYGHSPNTDAARWLVEAVMPLVWKTDRGITCRLVGGEMPGTVRRLKRPGVVPVGFVEDLGAEVFDKVRLTVAPLRYGAGVKGKVLESFAAGVPCVMSDIAAEGMPLSPVLQDLVGHDPAALAALICRLHADEDANRIAAAAGLAMIDEYFNQDAATEALKVAIEGRLQP